MQRLSPLSCAHRAPAGFPAGIPGIGDEMDGAMQQAPHPMRQEIFLMTGDQAGGAAGPAPFLRCFCAYIRSSACLRSSSMEDG